MVTAAFYSIVIIISLAGFLMARDFSLQSLYSLKNRMSGYHNMGVLFQDRFAGSIFKKTALEIDRSRFEAARLLILAAGAVWGIICRHSEIFIIALLIYGISMPVEKYFRITTPYGMIYGFLKKRTMDRMDEEVYEAMAFLKNIAANGKNFRYGADCMIEQLAGCGDLLKPIYFKMLNLLRVNRKEDAFEHFARETGTRSGRDFGRLLILLDEISPREFEETLLSCQKSIREVKITKKKQQDETISDLIYLPVVVNVLLIFINFIYVAYFIEQKNMFGVLVN